MHDAGRVVDCLHIKAGHAPDQVRGAADVDSATPVWTVSFNLGVMDKHARLRDWIKTGQFLFPENARISADSFEVLTLQWESTFWFGQKYIIFSSKLFFA